MKFPTNIKRKNLIILTIILFIAFITRILYWESQMHVFNVFSDALNYDISAHQLVENHIYGYGMGHKSLYPNAYMVPGYILFLAGVFALIKNYYLQITAVRLLQILLGSITPLLGYLFVKNLFKKENAALLTAFFAAVYPPYILSTFFLLTEVTALFTMVLYLVLAVLAFKKKKFVYNLLAGAAFAFHVLIRPTLLPLFIFPFIYGFFKCFDKNLKTTLVTFGQTLVGFIIIMSPWWIRNYVTLHQLILTATGSANPLLAGSYPDMKDLFKDFIKAGCKSTDQSWFAKKRIINGFTHHTWTYLKWYTIGKIKFMFENPWLYEKLHIFRRFNHWLHALISWGGLIALIANLFNKESLRKFTTLYTVALLGLLLIFIPTTRYIYQLLFLLMVSTSLLICDVYEALSSKFIKNAN